MKKVFALSFIVFAMTSFISCSNCQRIGSQPQAENTDTLMNDDCQGGCDVVSTIKSFLSSSHTPQNGNQAQPKDSDTVVYDNCQGRCDVKETISLRIYTPHYRNIYLSKGPLIPEMLPERSFVCAADYSTKINAKTGEAEIVGPHATKGKLYAGTPTNHVTGYFIFLNKEYKFINSTDKAILDSVAKNNGIAFGQDMLIYNHFLIKTQREIVGRDRKDRYRALCSINDTLRIVESKDPINFKKFQKLLLNIGSKYAIYLDMGTYKYGWYQTETGFVELHKENFSKSKYSNFLIFSM